MPKTKAPKPPREALPVLDETQTPSLILGMPVAHVLPILLALVFLVFANALNNPFVLDDESKIVENPDIRSLSELPDRLIYPYHTYQVLTRNDPSRPVVFITYALNYAISGTEPWSYHLFDLLVHLLSGFLLFRLSSQWFKRVGLAEPDLWALLFTALYLLHPLNAGTVIYAYGRSDTLSSLLCLLVLNLCFFPWFQRGSQLLAAACFALALLAKQSTVVLPGIVALGAWWLQSPEERKEKGMLHGLLLQIAVALAYLGWRWSYFGGLGDLEAHGRLWGRGEYAATQPLVVSNYLKLTFWPAHQAIDHYLVRGLIPEKDLIRGVIWFVGMLVALVFLGRLLPSKMRKLYYWGLGFYFIALAPTSSFFPTVDVMVERRVYLPNMGLMLSICLLIAVLSRHVRLKALPLKEAFLAAILVLSVLTWLRNEVFDDPKKVWGEVAAIYPDSLRALNNAATQYMREKNFQEAINIFQYITERYRRDGPAHSNLGSIYANEEFEGRDPAKAEEHFRRAVSITPNSAESWYGLGRLLQMENRDQEAETAYLKTIEVNPNYILAYNNLALIYRKQGQLEKSEELFKRALRIDPTHPLILKNFQGDFPPGGMPMAEGQDSDPDQLIPPGIPHDMVIRLYREAIEKDPNNEKIREVYRRVCEKIKCPKD